MKSRNFFLSGTAMVALVAAFGFTTPKQGVMASWVGTPAGGGDSVCFVNGHTDQPTCSKALTGPVCTVTPGVLSTRTAYDIGVTTCVYPLRQP